jgi:hypothetical protein
MFYNIIKFGSRPLFAFLLVLWLAPGNSLFAQQEPAGEETSTEEVDTSGVETEEAAEEEEPEKLGSRLGLTTTQFPGDTVRLQALLRAKIDDVWQKLGDQKIEFFAIGDEDETPLGEAVTAANGVATLFASANKMQLNADGYLVFAARYAGNEQLDESEEEAYIRKAVLTLTPEKGDSSLVLNVKAVMPSADGDVPVADATIVVMVQRMVGNLKIGEGTTDENGEASISLPLNLPGDDLGNLFLTAMIEDFEECGNIGASTVQPWGIPVSFKPGEIPRNLWSPNPPIWMVITFLVLMTAVWGHYAVIVYKLNQIKKAGS